MLEVEPESGGAQGLPRPAPEEDPRRGGAGPTAATRPPDRATVAAVRRGAFALVVAAVLFGVALTGCESDSSGSSDDGGGGKPAEVTVVAQNLLHGIACPADTDRCKLPAARRALRPPARGGEVPAGGRHRGGRPRDGGTSSVTRRRRSAPVTTTWSPTTTRRSTARSSSPRCPVLGQERVRLAGPLRTALWVRFRAPVGPLDVVATHLASGSDDRPCDRNDLPGPLPGRRHPEHLPGSPGRRPARRACAPAVGRRAHGRPQRQAR